MRNLFILCLLFVVSCGSGGGSSGGILLDLTQKALDGVWLTTFTDCPSYQVGSYIVVEQTSTSGDVSITTSGNDAYGKVKETGEVDISFTSPTNGKSFGCNGSFTGAKVTLDCDRVLKGEKTGGCRVEAKKMEPKDILLYSYSGYVDESCGAPITRIIRTYLTNAYYVNDYYKIETKDSKLEIRDSKENVLCSVGTEYDSCSFVANGWDCDSVVHFSMMGSTITENNIVTNCSRDGVTCEYFHSAN